MILSSILANDVLFEQLLFSFRTPFLVQVAQVVTFFGNTTTIIAIAALVGMFLLRTRAYRPYLVGFFVSLVGAAGSGYLVKHLVMRARPDALLQAVAETGYSFPSGHATAAMAFYGFIAFLLCKGYPQYKKCIVAVATFVIFSIGMSRLYLGVHFPSDVLAGFILGGLWLFVGISVTRRPVRTEVL